MSNFSQEYEKRIDYTKERFQFSRVTEDDREALRAIMRATMFNPEKSKICGMAIRALLMVDRHPFP
jgi:hypothetical protein